MTNVEAQVLVIKKLIAAMTLLVSLLQQQQPTQNLTQPTQKLGGVKLGVVQPLTDYKFWYIKRDDTGKITEAAVRFYEGAITTELERTRIDGIATTAPVTRYRRNKRLSKTDIPHIPERFIKEKNGTDVKIYTNMDFGDISTKEQLSSFVNTKLSGDLNRTPIAEQQ